MAGGVLDVVRARGRRRAALGELARAALMRAQQPAAGRALVDRPAHERVAEAEAARHVGGPDEAEREQLVDRLHRRRLVDARGGGGELGLERVARDRRALAAAVRVGRREQRELLRSSAAATARGHADAASRRRAGRRCRLAGPAGGPGELLEVERVAAALLVERVRERAVDVVAEQLARLLAPQRAELEPVSRPPRSRALERAGEALGSCRGRAASASSTGADGRRRSSAPSSSIDAGSAQCTSSSTQHERLARGEALEQLAHRAMRAVALVLQRRAGAAVAAPTATGAPARARRAPRRRASRGGAVQARDVLVERVDEDPERQVASSSDALPLSTMQPRASARAASSASSRVLPMPGSPSTSSGATGSPRSSPSARRRARPAPRRARRGARRPGPS